MLVRQMDVDVCLIDVNVLAVHVDVTSMDEQT